MMILLGGSTTAISIKDTNSIFYVDDDNVEGPWDGTLNHPFRYIQDAIENASAADTIKVFPGIYKNPKRNVDVTKTLSIIGNGSSDTFVNRTVSILADSVLFRGFTVKGFDYSTTKNTCCIRIKNSDNCDINNNTIALGLCGIELYDSHDNKVENNCIMERAVTKPSIYLYSSSSNLIRRNHIDIYSRGSGVYLDHCQNNIINENRIYDNIDQSGYPWSGMTHLIFLLFSCNNTISRNNLSHAYRSIGLSSSSHNIIENNTIKNVSTAMRFLASNNNIIQSNIISEVSNGISFWESNNNVVSQNSLIGNDGVGIRLSECCNNIIKSNNITKNSRGIIFNDNTNNNTIYHNNIKENGDKNYSWTGGIRFDGKYGTGGKQGKIFGNNICWNNIQSNYGVGVNLSFGNINNIIENNNFIGNDRHADFSNSWGNSWNSNYWDDMIGFGPKLIFGKIERGAVGISWINIDWRPALKPYDI